MYLGFSDTNNELNDELKLQTLHTINFFFFLRNA